MNKTKANIGMIELFYETYMDEVISEDESGLAPFIRKRIDHKKYYSEECEITEYANGWTNISYDGLNVVVPSRFVNYYESDKPLPKELHNTRRRGL